MFNMLPFKGKNDHKGVGRKKASKEISIDSGKDTRGGLFNVSNFPKEMDVFWSTLEDFIPEGKTWSELTEDEKKNIRNKYRFAFLRPGEYQAITGIGGDNGQMYP